jgi:hypothetical protein
MVKLWKMLEIIKMQYYAQVQKDLRNCQEIQE